MAVKIQVRNGTASEWITHNPTLMEGEIAVEKDTRKFKIGNGSLAWNSLPYATQGEQGEKGEPFRYDDFTSEQLAQLTGPQGPSGSIDNLNASDITTALGHSLKDLSNVDNKKQMPISGGVLENYREKLTTVSASGGSINLSLGNVFQHSPSGNRTYSITNAVNGQAHSFTLIITQTATVRTLTFPASVKWQGEEIPDMSTANKTYVLTFVSVDGGSTWLGMSGGDF